MLQLRSRENSDPAYVRFDNRTGRPIDVLWIDYSGDLVRYATLGPGEYLDINTFKTHPWMFIDPRTGEKMKIGSGRIFYPASCREISARLGLHEGGDFRVIVPVLLPLFTLRQISLQVVLNCLHNMNGVTSLDLPTNLQNDLHQLNKNKQSILSLYKVS